MVAYKTVIVETHPVVLYTGPKKNSEKSNPQKISFYFPIYWVIGYFLTPNLTLLHSYLPDPLLLIDSMFAEMHPHFRSFIAGSLFFYYYGSNFSCTVETDAVLNF